MAWTTGTDTLSSPRISPDVVLVYTLARFGGFATTQSGEPDGLMSQAYVGGNRDDSYLMLVLRNRYIVAVATTLLVLVGMPVAVSAAAARTAMAAQCLEGQVPSGGACILAPTTPVPPTAAPSPDPSNDGANPADGDADGESNGDDENSTPFCTKGQNPEEDDCVVAPPACPAGFAEDAQGRCYEVLDRRHPCVVAGKLPAGVTTNSVLATYTYIPATGECVTQDEFRERVRNFEATAVAEKEALAELQAITEVVAELEDALKELDRDLLDVRRELLLAEDEARYAEIRRDATEGELNAVQATLEVERERFKSEAVNAYMGGNKAGLLAGALLSTDDVNDLEASMDYASAILEDQRITVDRVEALEALAEDLLTKYSAAVTVASEAADAIRDVEADVEALMADKRELLRDQEAQVDREAAKIAEIRSDKERYAGELGSTTEESKEIAAIVAEAQRFTGQVAGTPGMMFAPLDPMTFGSGFGPRMHPILGFVRPHEGIDLSGASGTLIRAAGDGVVILAGPHGGFGNAVVIDHGDLLSTLYAHQSSIAVEVGAIVSAGDIIGAVGSTGLSTGPHLHFEVRVSGIPVDPAPYLNGQSLISGSAAEQPIDSVEPDVEPSTDAGDDSAAGDDEPGEPPARGGIRVTVLTPREPALIFEPSNPAD